MNCAEVLEHITEYMDGTLAESRRAQMEAHLGACRSCGKVAADIAQMAQSLRSLRPVEVPAGFQRRLNDRLDRLTLFPFRRYLIPAAVGAGLVAISFGVMRVTQPVRPAMRSTVMTEEAATARAQPAPAPGFKIKGIMPALKPAAPAPKVAPEAPVAELGESLQQPKPAPRIDAFRAQPGNVPSGGASQVQRAPEMPLGTRLPPVKKERSAGQRSDESADAMTGYGAAVPPPPPVEAPAATSASPPQAGGVRDRTAAADRARGEDTDRGAAMPQKPKPAPKPVIKVVTVPESIGVAGRPSAPGGALLRGWLGNARVRVVKTDPHPRPGAGMPVALDIQPQAASGALSPSLGRVAQEGIAAVQSHNIEIVAVPLSQTGPRIKAFGPPTARQAIQREIVREGASNAFTLSNVEQTPPSRPRPSDVYRVVVASEERESRTFLLFVPSYGVQGGPAVPRQALPADLLAILTARAGVTLLTPADLPAAYSLGVAPRQPEEALLSALNTIGLKVERDGRLWTAERP